MRIALNFRRVDPGQGGAETYVADLARRLTARGHAVDLYAESWAEGVLPGDVRCIRVPAHGRTRTSRIRNFAEASAAALGARGDEYDCTVGFINTYAHDVIIPQGGVHAASREHNARRFPAGWQRWLYRTAKAWQPRAGLYRELERKQYDPATGARLVVAVSRFVQRHLERHHGVPPGRVRVIPNAIDAGRLAVPDPAAVRRDFRAAHGLKESDLVALFVGHNFRLKGLGPLLEALHERSRANPASRPIHLLVCGGGRIAPFARMVRRLGLQATVHLIGFAPDVRAPFHASDFFVSPTYYDPCSLVVFEALACGLPVITTACNGAGEVMTEGREGFVIPEPDDRPALIAALDRVAIDADRGAMAVAAAALGRAQSFDRHVGRLLDVFAEVAAARRAGRGSPGGPHGSRQRNTQAAEARDAGDRAGGR
jgi:UDP-glucose:(heptosyl)LPS alpha-1,3-glucosyltransferase